MSFVQTIHNTIKNEQPEIFQYAARVFNTNTKCISFYVKYAAVWHWQYSTQIHFTSFQRRTSMMNITYGLQHHIRLSFSWMFKFITYVFRK